jgi:phosphatidylethanolamine/phosphatidyl-N-methylethanolamine N-methyltransferase
MREEPSYETFLQQWSGLYESTNYDGGLAGYFLAKSHAWCESSFGANDHFPRVLEVGAGTGVHVGYVRHSYDEYVMTDLNPPMLASADRKATAAVLTEVQDATALTYEDESFDRVIAVHVLEHLPRPHEVLREWFRVLRPGGTMSIVLPCDPGAAWRLGRAVGARGKFVKQGIDYDYWMAREHINAINSLVSFLRYYFPRGRTERWLPFRIPSMDLNLFYITHIRKQG